uniref:Uncharacterized protein n=1 Tax=Romanomermis culicivorax TaxID=13658 RepID=A0A915JLV2_ROMCU
MDGKPTFTAKNLQFNGEKVKKNPHSTVKDYYSTPFVSQRVPCHQKTTFRTIPVFLEPAKIKKVPSENHREREKERESGKNFYRDFYSPLFVYPTPDLPDIQFFRDIFDNLYCEKRKREKKPTNHVAKIITLFIKKLTNNLLSLICHINVAQNLLYHLKKTRTTLCTYELSDQSDSEVLFYTLSVAFGVEIAAVVGPRPQFLILLVVDKIGESICVDGECGVSPTFVVVVEESKLAFDENDVAL